MSMANQPPPQPRAKNWKPASIEDQVRHAYYVPSSHEYRPEQPARFQDPPGGRISQSVIPSALDAPIRTSAAVPGPGAYDVPPSNFLPEGGRMFGNPDAVSAKDLLSQLKVEANPGPDRYTPTDKLVKPALAGVKFEKGSKEAKYIQDAQRLGALVPGPGAYDTESASEYVKPFVPEGGRTLMASKPTTTYFDDAAALTKANPGPAAYTLPGSIDVRPVGQPVFRHESTTAAESRKLVERLTDSSSTPGPGTYDLPDAHPLMPAPSLKGRALPHGMPKPFDYNANPDYAGNFAPRPKEMQLAPIRQRNSGVQIFGRFSASGASGNSAGGKQSASGNKILFPAGGGSGMTDEVFEEEPEGEANVGLATEEIEDKVVWKEGGFETSGAKGSVGMDSVDSLPGMNRAQSLDSFGAAARRPQQQQQPRHPSVEKAAKSYSRLSGFRKKPTKTFLPMASRRCPIVSTEDTSAEFQRYYVCKSRLEEAGAKISQIGDKVLEPLDLDQLLMDAQSVLELKARMRLRVEGVSREKRMKVLAELPVLFQGAVGAQALPTGGFGEFVGGDSGDEPGIQG